MCKFTEPVARQDSQDEYSGWGSRPGHHQGWRDEGNTGKVTGQSGLKRWGSTDQQQQPTSVIQHHSTQVLQQHTTKVQQPQTRRSEDLPYDRTTTATGIHFKNGCNNATWSYIDVFLSHANKFDSVEFIVNIMF